MRRRLLEQFRQLLGHDATQFLGIDDGHGAAVIARHVMADADGNQFDRRARLDVLDDAAQVAFEIIAGVHRKRGIIDRRAIGDHHQDAPVFGPRHQPGMRPGQRFAVDVFLQQAFAHHQPEITPRAPPRAVGGLVDDVAQIVEAPRIGRLACCEPGFARLTTLPGAGGEAEDLDLHTAALQRARQDIGAGCRNGDRTAAHRA